MLWVVGVGIAFVYILVFALCKAASNADRQMDYIIKNELHKGDN